MFCVLWLFPDPFVFVTHLWIRGMCVCMYVRTYYVCMYYVRKYI